MPEPLTIGVDIRDLQTAKTGTKTYLEELCRAFKKLDGQELKFHFIDSSIPVYTGQNKILKLTEHLRYQCWKQLILPVKAWLKGCDIVFCTDTVVPLLHLGFQTIPVFHDAFFFETPEHYGKLWLWLYLKNAVPAAKRSPYIITPSAYAKKQINRYTGISNDKLVVVAEGPKELATEINNGDIISRFGLIEKNYLLHVGSMFKRKNIPALIRAFSIINKQHAELRLVLAGSPPVAVESDYQEIMAVIESDQLKNRVVFTGYLQDHELAALYRNALLYVFPSINEGFGIPVLEAFKFKLPVLAANNTSLPEVGGDAVFLFDPFDVDDIAGKISMALNDLNLRNELAAKGTERLKEFSWDKAALQLIEIFKKAV